MVFSNMITTLQWCESTSFKPLNSRLSMVVNWDCVISYRPKKFITRKKVVLIECFDSCYTTAKQGTAKPFWKPIGRRSLCTRRRKLPLMNQGCKIRRGTFLFWKAPRRIFSLYSSFAEQCACYPYIFPTIFPRAAAGRSLHKRLRNLYCAPAT